jgi:hypothetical protein
MRLNQILLAATFVVGSACASSQANDNELRVIEPKPKKQANVITENELRDPAMSSRDALTAIRMLRPHFFSYHGPTSFQGSSGATHISYDYGPLQDLKQLASTNTLNFIEVRFLNAEAATARFGLNADGGAVIVLVSNKDAQ